MTIFKEYQINDAYNENLSNHYWTIARFSILKKILSKFERGKVLDYGCGDGLFLNFLRKVTKFELVGLEPAKYPYQYFESIAIDLNDLKNRFKYHDIKILTLLDVIEHFEKPEILINKIISDISSIETILITVPARMELWSNYDLYYGHHLRYDFNSINNLIRNIQSFEVVYISYMYRFLYLPALVITNFKRRNTKVFPPKKFTSRLMHKLFSKVLYLDWIFFPKKLPGTSMVILLRKSNKT
jgi:SAM-dependent methyltransferase